MIKLDEVARLYLPLTLAELESLRAALPRYDRLLIARDRLRSAARRLDRTIVRRCHELADRCDAAARDAAARDPVSDEEAAALAESDAP